MLTQKNNPVDLKWNIFFLLQIIAALAVSLGPLAAGLGKGYSSPAIASLQDLQIRHRGANYTTFTVTDQEASWVASLSLLGMLSKIKEKRSINDRKNSSIQIYFTPFTLNQTRIYSFVWT